MSNEHVLIVKTVVRHFSFTGCSAVLRKKHLQLNKTKASIFDEGKFGLGTVIFFLTGKTNAMKNCSFQRYPRKWLRLGMVKSKKNNKIMMVWFLCSRLHLFISSNKQKFCSLLTVGRRALVLVCSTGSWDVAAEDPKKVVFILLLNVDLRQIHELHQVSEDWV